MTTPPTTPLQTPSVISPPKGRHLVIMVAVVLALGGALLPIAPELTIALVSLLMAYCLIFIARYAVFWLKHRPLPRNYDDNGKLQPNKIENFLLCIFAFSPCWVWAVFSSDGRLDFSFWLATALIVLSYFLGKLVLFRWWLPRRKRQQQREDSMSGLRG